MTLRGLIEFMKQGLMAAEAYKRVRDRLAEAYREPASHVIGHVAFVQGWNAGLTEARKIVREEWNRETPLPVVKESK